MTSPPVVSVDFETEAIQDGTGRSPRPVGVSINHRYYAWGHPTGNNSTFEESRRALAEVWDRPLVFHNGKFDINVAIEHFGFDWPKEWHDTMFLIYLDNPLSSSLALKPAAQRLLGIPPIEQEEVRNWLISNRIVSSNSNSWGAHISKAPGDLVGKYANGDTTRTEDLFYKLYPSIVERGMHKAYLRELQLTPILSESEKLGVRIDREKLERDYQEYGRIFNQLTTKIWEILGSEFNVDSGLELARALERSGKVENLSRTPTGRLSTARHALEGAVKDPDLLEALRYRSALKTLLNTFMSSWLELSAKDGRVHPSWNQVKGGNYGTRTGRLSCSSPNLQNVPTEFENMGKLPYMRQYILPEEGHILVAADYNGQEMRLLAHFSEGRAAEIYRTNPRADFHQVARDILYNEARLDLKRKQVKIVGFSLIYGAGAQSLADQLGLSVSQARYIRNEYLNAMPGLYEFQNDVSRRSKVRTWGGRIIPVEPPTTVNGYLQSYEYKLVNHLIQGSAADQTKQSIIEYSKVKSDHSRFLITVHDENVISVLNEPSVLAEEIRRLKEAMESLPSFDVPFIAEVEVGPNWHDLEEYRG